MKRFCIVPLVILLMTTSLSACRSKTSETMIPPAISNDDLGTRAAKTVYANFTEAAPSLIRDELSKPLEISGAPNTIQAACVGSTQKLCVNDKLTGEIVDREQTNGYPGIIAGTNVESGLDVLFDNFVITRP